MTTTNVSNVLNPKSLEKQIKLYDSRLAVLQAEVEELTRLRAACQLLLGTPAEASPAEAEAKAPKRGKKDSKDAEAAPEGAPEASAEEDVLLASEPEATHEAPSLDQ